MAGRLEVVWLLLCILFLLHLLPLSLFLLSSFLLACLLAGYLERANAAKLSEAAAIRFSFPFSSVAGYCLGRTLEDCQNNCAFCFWRSHVLSDLRMISGPDDCRKADGIINPSPRCLGKQGLADFWPF